MSGCDGYTRFGREEDAELASTTRNEGDKFRQYQAAILAALAATAAGTGDGWLLTAFIQREDNISSRNLTIFPYIMNFTALIGAISCGYITEKLGKKKTLILTGVLTLPTWILYLCSHKLIISLSIGVSIAGFASGLASVVIPVFISEISEVSIRGTLGILFYLQFIAGELFTTLEGTYNTPSQVLGTAIWSIY